MRIVMICIVIVVGIIVAILLPFYLVGNIYNGLVKRRIRVKTSWYEINKLFGKFFELLPELIKIMSEENEKKELRSIYQEYRSLNNKDDVIKVSNLYFQILKVLYAHSNGKEISNEDSVAFIHEYIRKINFSIPFYNSNVENYNHFRKLPINIIMAKMFHFEQAISIVGLSSSQIDLGK